MRAIQGADGSASSYTVGQHICSNGRRSYNYFQVWKDVVSIRWWLLFEGGYYSRMCSRVSGSIIYMGRYSAKNMECQVDEAFYFDSIVCGHHVYKTVWTLFLEEIVTAMYRMSCHHSQSFAPKGSDTALRHTIF